MSIETRSAEPPAAPRSTYRLQLNLNFTFADAAEIVPYLHDLGVSDLYASPYLQARPGSLHGYDISDHNRLNPELGGESEHDGLCRALREHRMGHLLDIVPNHMGIGEPSNLWWMDVLENGPSSPFSRFFDIDWSPIKPELTGKVLLPVLGDQFGRVLEKGELRLYFDQGRFRIGYWDQVFPVSPRSSSFFLRAVLTEMRTRVDEDDDDYTELESIVTALEHLPTRDQTSPESVAGRRRESFVSRRRLRDLAAHSAPFRDALETALEAYNGRPGEPSSFDRLEALLDDQPYRLAYWRVAAEEINYRRFFDINDLAGVRVERDDVFQATHELILRLVSEGKVTGLRIDHPDGLHHPSAYLRKLQNDASQHAEQESFYIVVEKILTGEEPLPDHWPVAGTVGYEFMNRVTGLFVARENAPAMTAAYERFIGERVNFANLAYDRKKLILRVALGSELNVLAWLLNRISEKNRRVRDFTLGSLRDAIRETIACFPVYRTYIDAVSGNVTPMDASHVERAIRAAMRRNRASSPTLFEFLRDILLLRWPDDLEHDAREEHALFVMKFQQLTGPVMAKGVEDTSFYIFNRLVSLNEVGGEPDHFGFPADRMHAWLRERRDRWPLALSSSTTHDTKRSEDVRARINVLSEIPEEWTGRVTRWAEWNAGRKTDVDGDAAPDANDEYLLYQTLVGALPLDGFNGGEGGAEFRDRILRYMEKATREAKVHTSWINPNEAYEEAMRNFIQAVLDTPAEADGPGRFRDDVTDLASLISADGMRNSLAQTLIKLAAPGVPDVYQGQEVWDFSLVDPDNRRPVDYERRWGMLRELRERLESAGSSEDLAADLLAHWPDGRIKLYLTHVALMARKKDPELFASGDYLPIDPIGEHRDHLFAFARVYGDRGLIVAVPRLPAIFRRRTGEDVETASAWGDTSLLLPPGLPPGRYRDLFTGRVLAVGMGTDAWTLGAGRLFDRFPIAMLKRGE